MKKGIAFAILAAALYAINAPFSKNIARLHSADFNGGFSLCRCRNRNDYNCTRPQNQKNRNKRIKTDKIGIAVHCGNDTFGRSRTDLL